MPRSYTCWLLAVAASIDRSLCSAPMPAGAAHAAQHDRWIIRGVLAFGGGGGVAVILGSTRRSAKMATTPAPRTQWSYKEGPEANTRIDSSAIYY
ncbi:hypothetical protein BDA96_09G259800 [Sorghum bicolor]|uniref:Secreted protein n=1 Tax=Sorghum bicolor TaxID=4558 RepID=A0A921U5C7_SORBI|nr:hypothetical protein BDA96_09G259800 [Sorghum bicolor]